MVRLIVALAIAILTGYGLGTIQFKAGYTGVDERFADLSAYDQPGDGTAPATKSATPRSKKADPIVDEPPSKAPKVQVTGGTTYDFGTMQQGGEKSHSFTFKNIGDAPMELKVAGSSCRCTIGTLADSMLEPGEETGVTLTWKATGVIDQFSQTATIVTNDPHHRNVLLTVKGIVSRTILIEPNTINLGDVPVGQGVHRTAYVFGYGETPMEVTSVTWGDERTTNMVDIQVTPIEVDVKQFPHHERAKGAAKIDLTIKKEMGWA